MTRFNKSASRSRRSDRGSGVLGTTFGVGVFLTLLFFASHILLNLWVRSTIDDAAYDAAFTVAVATPADRPAAQRAALTAARQAMGNYTSRVTLTFEPSNNDRVVLRVEAPSINLLPPLASQLTDSEGLQRTIVVRAENVR